MQHSQKKIIDELKIIVDLLRFDNNKVKNVKTNNKKNNNKCSYDEHIVNQNNSVDQERFSKIHAASNKCTYLQQKKKTNEKLTKQNKKKI